MKNGFLSFLVGVVLIGCSAPPSSQKASVKSESIKDRIRPRRLEVLFLGDKTGHHKPAERVPQLMAALGPKGFNFTYTDNLEDLNPETLNKYDALLLYANWDSIAAPQATALLDFVASGKGFIPVHCASYCFRNNAEVVKLIGGQFWKHTWDTIQPVWINPQHPAIAGVKPFKTVDETYLHTLLQPDNIVLTERLVQQDQERDKPGRANEPYTWVRTHGKGRVFYTAYGHDERTWSVPGFHDLLEKGILWAVNEDARKSLLALQPRPFEYREARLPNYEQRPGTQYQQLPLSPEESVKHIQVPVDFTLDVFAHEPDVMHPIAMSWDERGRLFVLITKDYPNDRKETGGDDYILICEDTNQDGKADKFTRFAEGLSIPTGMVFANGGLIVSQAPHMLFLKDTDGDDKADVKKVLFSGFGTFDTHAGPSNLHYGFDNWIYASVGYSGFKGKAGKSDSLNFGQALFKFRPDGSDIELLARTSNNTWGLGFNESGDLFGSTANNSHGWYVAIPDRYFGKSKVDNGSRSTDTHKDMQPITPKVRQVDVFGGFTAAAGHNFYTARAYPRKYWNRVAFVSEPTGHLVHQNSMEKKGTNFEDVLDFNLLAGADEWVAPVFAQVGPDGAVWVADWYSYIIQHNPTPKGFENGKGNAYDTDLRDFTHGRLYRIGWKHAPPYTPMSLSKERPAELVATLSNSNLLWRSHAQRLLVERGQRDVVPALLALVKNTTVDEIGLNAAALHALWTLEGLGVMDEPSVLEAVTGALRHPSPAVRRAAVQLLPRTAEMAGRLLKENMLQDKEPLVVLHTLLAFSEMPMNSQVEEAVLALLNAYPDVDDRWMPDAFGIVMNAHGGKLRQLYLRQRVESSRTKAKGSEVKTGSMAAAPHHEGMHHDGHKAAGITVQGKAELVVTDILLEPKKVYVREWAKAVIEITNQGSVAVPKGVIPLVTVSIKGEGLDLNYVSRKLSDGIAPGEKILLSEGNNGPWRSDFSFTPETAGSVQITATIDQDNVVPEQDEIRNNTLTRSFGVHRPQSLADFALERAVRSYTSYASADSVVALVKQSRQLDRPGQEVVMKGVTSAWNSKRKAVVSKEDERFLVALKNDLPEEQKNRITPFMESLGIQDQVVEDPDLQIVKIKAVREEMKFSSTEFTVKAGKMVEIVFENPDAMQHNIVFGKPKTAELIGAAADKMITARDAAERNYVPSVPQIIAASPLVSPDQTFRLRFKVPLQTGDYPYLCTFPGHWRLMRGIMKVVKE